MQLSMFYGARATKPTRVDSDEFWEDIRTGKWEKEITDLRNLLRSKGKEAYNEKKKELSAITMSGLFLQRAANSMVRYSGLIQGDIDSVENPEQLRDELSLDPHVRASFLSPSGKGVKIAIRVPEIFYVLRNDESLEPDSFIAEAGLIKKHQSEEPDEPISVEVQLGRDQIDSICRLLQSEFTTETKNITSFKSYVHNLESNALKMAIQEVENFLQEMRDLEQDYKGDNIYKFFQEHWAQYGEDFYFIVKSIDLAGIRVVRDSSLLEQLNDDQKIEIYLEVH